MSVPTRVDDFRIRPATLEDLPDIVRIEAAAFEPSRRSSRRSLRRALKSPFQRVLVLESGEALAGYLIVWPHPRSWRIYNLATDPGMRNRGVAGALLSAAITAARGAGADRVMLESRAETGLVGYYEQRGFRVQRRLRDYYSEGEDAVRMVMPLGMPASVR